MYRKPYDRFGTISAEIQALLDKSKESVGGRTERKVRCPQCGYVLFAAFGHSDIPVMVRCKKCKFEGILNLGMFRTVGRKYRKPSKTAENRRKRVIR